MKKQTFKIPEGCKSVTIEQIENGFITIFNPIEPKIYIPKVGDYFKTKNTIAYCDLLVGTNPKCTGAFIDINEQKVNTEIGHLNVTVMSHSNTFEQITPIQLQSEFNKLGYVYDFETHTANKKRWRAGKGGYYHYVDCYFKPDNLMEDYDDGDNRSYESGNYFQTKEQAQKAADFLKQQLKEFNSK